jgi:hypothetical protein
VDRALELEYLWESDWDGDRRAQFHWQPAPLRQGPHLLVKAEAPLDSRLCAVSEGLTLHRNFVQGTHGRASQTEPTQSSELP